MRSPTCRASGPTGEAVRGAQEPYRSTLFMRTSIEGGGVEARGMKLKHAPAAALRSRELSSHARIAREKVGGALLRCRLSAFAIRADVRHATFANPHRVVTKLLARQMRCRTPRCRLSITCRLYSSALALPSATNRGGTGPALFTRRQSYCRVRHSTFEFPSGECRSRMQGDAWCRTRVVLTIHHLPGFRMHPTSAIECGT